jgi:hypothetical protein
MAGIDNILNLEEIYDILVETHEVLNLSPKEGERKTIKHRVFCHYTNI